MEKTATKEPAPLDERQINVLYTRGLVDRATWDKALVLGDAQGLARRHDTELLALVDDSHFLGTDAVVDAVPLVGAAAVEAAVAGAAIHECGMRVVVLGRDGTSGCGRRQS